MRTFGPEEVMHEYTDQLIMHWARTLTTTASARVALDDHRDGQTVVHRLPQGGVACYLGDLWRGELLLLMT
jgi:hypothetical protein